LGSSSKEQLVELLKRIDDAVGGADAWAALVAVCRILETHQRD